MSEAQSFKNHTKFFPPFHFVVLPVLLVNFVWHIYRLVRAFSAGTVISFLVSVALAPARLQRPDDGSGGSGSRDSSRNALAFAASVAGGLASQNRGICGGSAGSAAICKRCGAARFGPKSLAGQNHRPQSHQAARPGLAARQRSRITERDVQRVGRAAGAAPSSRSFACARRASSEPAKRRSTSRRSRIPLAFIPSSSSAMAFFSREAGEFKALRIIRQHRLVRCNGSLEIVLRVSYFAKIESRIRR